MIGRTSALRPAFALAACVSAQSALAQTGLQEDRRVHDILAVQEVSVAGALQTRDFAGLTNAESRINADVGPAMRTKAKNESPCIGAAKSLAMLAGVSSSALVQEPDPRVSKGLAQTADRFGAEMRNCEARIGVRPSARPPFEIFLKHLVR